VPALSPSITLRVNSVEGITAQDDPRITPVGNPQTGAVWLRQAKLNDLPQLATHRELLEGLLGGMDSKGRRLGISGGYNYFWWLMKEA
jgi:hypothetical protein